MLHRSAARLTLLAGLLLGCGKDTSPSSAPASEPAAAASPAGSNETPRRKRQDKDRGEAAMKLGATAWSADRAKASLKDKKLVIRASTSRKVGTTMQRDELHLTVDDYQGPGDYTVAATGSRFVSVGIDTKAAEGSDGEVTDEAVKAIAGSTHLMLSGAKVTVTTASDSEISGTFAWQSPAAKDSPMTDGTFRAVLGK